MFTTLTLRKVFTHVPFFGPPNRRTVATLLCGGLALVGSVGSAEAQGYRPSQMVRGYYGAVARAHDPSHQTPRQWIRNEPLRNPAIRGPVDGMVVGIAGMQVVANVGSGRPWDSRPPMSTSHLSGAVRSPRPQITPPQISAPRISAPRIRSPF